MPDISVNRSVWSGWYDWKGAGEEWSEAWGNSEAQWFGSIFPRVHAYLPTSNILEIAPGYGRWTAYLLPLCDRYIGIDLSDECITACKKRFGKVDKATFVKNDGRSLSAAADAKFGLVFSFDSLVHAGADVLDGYVQQILALLEPTGVAFLHHSNLLEFQGAVGNPHSRDETVSAQLVAQMVAQAGGQIVIQEVINWGGDDLCDCLTLFEPLDGRAKHDPVLLRNERFMDEARIIADYHRHYVRRATPVGD